MPLRMHFRLIVRTIHALMTHPSELHWTSIHRSISTKRACLLCARRGRCNYRSRASTSWTPVTPSSPRPRKERFSRPVCGTGTRQTKLRRCVACIRDGQVAKAETVATEGRFCSVYVCMYSMHYVVKEEAATRRRPNGRKTRDILGIAPTRIDCP